MILDAIVLLVLIVAVWIAFRGGMIQLLLVEVGFFGVWSIFLGHWPGYVHLAQALHVPSGLDWLPILVVAGVLGYLGSRIGGLVHRMPWVLGWDGLLGVFAHAFIAVLLCYGAISTLVVLGQALQPGMSGQGLNVAQAQRLRAQILANPVLAALVDSADLDQLSLRQAKNRPDGVRLEELPSLQQLSLLYGDFAEPQLKSSHLAPAVMGIGSHVPFAGHVTSKQLPRPTPSVSPSPSPSAPH